MEAKQLAELYVETLADIGLVAKIDDDMDVVFKAPGMGAFFIDLNAEKDPEFMRLVFPSFYESQDALKVLSAINTVNLQNKAVKLWSLEKDGTYKVSAVVEGFLAGSNQAPGIDLLKATMERCISAINAGVKSLAQEISGISK